MYDEGTYRARARRWGYTKTANGHVQFAMTFEVVGRTDPGKPGAPLQECEQGIGTWSITVTGDANAEWLRSVLEVFGYDRKDWLGLDPDRAGAFDFSGREFTVRCKHDVYKDRPREQWSVVPESPLSDEQLHDFNDRFVHVLKDVRARKSDSTGGAPRDTNSDDAPF
jgi:hypothetical protein